MTVVVFTKIAAGPSLGPYDIGDVVDINATDLSRLTGHTEPNGVGASAVTALSANDPRIGKPTKKGT